MLFLLIKKLKRLTEKVKNSIDNSQRSTFNTGYPFVSRIKLKGININNGMKLKNDIAVLPNK